MHAGERLRAQSPRRATARLPADNASAVPAARRGVPIPRPKPVVLPDKAGKQLPTPSLVACTDVAAGRRQPATFNLRRKEGCRFYPAPGVERAAPAPVCGPREEKVSRTGLCRQAA
jgi:hypothetical protein